MSKRTGDETVGDYLEVDFLSVETKKSGDAIALRYQVSGQTWIHVIDGGYLETGDRLRDHINQYYGNPARVDNVVVTHNDGDHTRGLKVILESFEVSQLWMLRPWIYANELLPRFTTYSSARALESTLRAAYSNLADLEAIADRRNIPILEPFQGEMIGIFRVMAPTRPRYLDLIASSTKTPESSSAVDAGLLGSLVEMFKTATAYIRAGWGEEVFPPGETSAENEMSVVQFAYIDQTRLLLTGDTGRAGLQEVIDYAPYIGLALPGIDRFQVPHHGGRHNVNSELLDKILGPKLENNTGARKFSSYISSAKEDEDHPRKVVVRALIHRGSTVYSTEGVSIHTGTPNAPPRGWSAAVPVNYPEEYEE